MRCVSSLEEVDMSIVRKKIEIIILGLSLGCLLLIPVRPGWAKPAKASPPKSTAGKKAETRQARKDFVVSGEDKLKVRSDKLLRLLFVDVDKPIQKLMMESSELSQRILPEKEIALSEKAGMISESRMTFSPWLTLITKQPVLVIKAKKRELGIKSWKFVITDETGNILYIKKGGSRLPGHFIWDGRCRDGSLVGVGESFYYSVTMVDKADNPLFTSSKPKKLNSLAYYEKNNLHIDILSSVLFDKKMRSDLSNVGVSLMNESCDYIIKDIGRMTYITVHAMNPKLGQGQGETARKFIIDKLAIPKEDIQIKVVPARDDLMAHINIWCKR